MLFDVLRAAAQQLCKICSPTALLTCVYFCLMGPAVGVTKADTAQSIYVVGHRGAPHHAPENTLPSHEAAIRMGAHMIEMDVRYTKDGHFVVIHDATVNRTTNGRGRVSRMTLKELKALDAGAWMGPEFIDTRIPTLREALRHLNFRAGVDIDFKGGPSNSGELIADILDEEGYRSGPLVTIFARYWHYGKLKGVLGRYQLRPHYMGARRTRRLAKEDGIEIMGLRRRGFSFAKAKTIRNANVEIFANTMGAFDGPPGYRDSVQAGATFIQTNHINDLVNYLSAEDKLRDCLPAHNLKCWTRSYAVSDADPEHIPIQVVAFAQ